jgi:hypothetical protein
MALHIANIAELTLNMLNNFVGHPVLNRRLLLSSMDGWCTVHVSTYLKAFALKEQKFARLVVLYVPAKFKTK